MEVHHIVGGANRSKGHKIFNYLKLCERCHQVYHSGKVVANTPPLNLGHMLTAKKESDPDNYDPQALAELKNRKALHWEPEPIPGYYIRERERNTR
jgi:cytochrome c2